MNKVLSILLACGLLSVVLSCSRGPYAATNKAYHRQAKQYAALLKQYPLRDSFATADFVGTTNFNMRKPNYVVIHHTAQNSCEQTLKTFTLPRTAVSAHYVICRNGTVYHMLNDYLRAWHAGAGRWGTHADMNSASIGIELDNNGFEPFSDAQITSLINVLGALKRAFAVPAANFIGHSDVAPTRKVDPNVQFPWKRLADHGFGIWWSDTTNLTVPTDFNTLNALRIIGYDTKDTVAAIQAFKRKYMQQDKSSAFTESEKKILYSIYRKVE